jgi:hypothetical protein
MIRAYAAREKGGKLEPFDYDPGILGPEFDVRKSARNQWSKELETFCPRNSILNKN